MRRYLKRGCAAFLASTMILGLLPNMSVQAAEESEKAAKEVAAASDFDAYRAPFLSGPIQTWVYQGEEFDYENSKNQIFADDQEDGDLTKSIIQKGFVDTSELGDQTVTYEVTDSDGHKSTLETTVTVLAKDETDETKKYMQRILYTIPDATHLTQIGFNRGYYHDRQNLGFWVPAEETLTVRLVNYDEFSDKLRLQLLNNDGWSEDLITVADDGTEGEYKDGRGEVEIPNDGNWITVKNKCKVWTTVPDPTDPTKTIHQKTDEFHYVDSVPFIYTPHNTTVRPIIEIKWNDAFQSIPYYRYGDDEESFFNDWDAKKSPYAIIEGQAATFLVPIKDRNNIIDKQGPDSAYSFHTIDDMLEWYAGFVTQYDAYTGLDFYTDDPACQNVRAKFFIKANRNGVGLAYYGGNHSANNDDNLGDYLCKNWVSLHEFGHGYEGEIRSQEYALIETTNNVMGFYYEKTYRPETDFGWLLGDAHGDKAAWVEEYRKLGKESEELRNSVSSFDEPKPVGSGPVIEHRNRLFMFTNALDILGSEKTTAAMHTQFRKYVYDSGNKKRPSSGNVIVDSFSRMGGYNMAPYFDSWHIVPSDEVKEAIYDEDLPMLYYIRNLIPDDTEAEKVRKELSEKRVEAGKDALNGIYSIVSTDDIASLSTKYTSKVKLSVSIDDATAIAGKKILIKNGEQIVKEVVLGDSNNAVYDIELPAGIYEVELPTPRKAGYEYDKEYLVAAATNIGAAAGTSVEKELSYKKISGDPLVEDVAFWLMGFGWHVVDFALNTGEDKLTCRINDGTPHSGVDADRYIQITVQDPNGNQLWDRTLKAKEKYPYEENVFDFPIGSKLIIYHNENKLYFDSKYTKKDLRSLYFKADAGKTYTYVMTKYGLMPENFSEDQMQETYLSLLCSYSDYLIENVMTESDIANEGRLNNLKQPIRIAYEKLNNAAKEEYDRLYGRLLGHETTMYGYDRIPLSLLTGTADSYQSGEEPSKALNEDDNNAWHTAYNGVNCITDKKNTYTITLSEPRNVSRLEYESKDGGENGRILTYKLEYSTTESGDNFQPVKAFRLPAWANDASKKSVDFEAPQARRIRITGLSTAGSKDDAGNGKFMNAKHFWLYEKHEKKQATSYLSDLQLGMGSNARTDKENKTVTLSGSQGITADLIGKEFDNLSAKVSLANADAGACFKIYNGEGKGAKLLYQFEKTAQDSEETFSVDVAGIRKLRFEISDGVQAVLSNAKFGNQEHKKNIYMVKGDAAAVSANMSLNSSVTGLTTWTSGDEQIATVDENGIITAVSAGNTTIREQIGTAEPLVCNVYVSDTLEELIQEIKAVQTAKKKELSGYKDASQYNAEGKVALTAEINAGCEAIDAAMNVSGIHAALNAAKEKLDIIASAMEEKAEELQQKKEEAKQELADYKNSADYRKEQRQELKRAIAEGWLSISQQATLDDVDEVLADAKKALDAILTDLQMTREELRTALADVRRRIKGLEAGEYPEAAWQRLQTKLSEADALLNNTEAGIQELSAGKNELLAALNVLLKPQAVKDAETALQKIIDEYAGLVQDNYQFESWAAYQTALTEAKTYLPGGENEQFTTPAPVLAAKDDLVSAKNALESNILVLEGDWVKGLRASESAMTVKDGKMNLTGKGGNNDPATFVCAETFDFSKDGSFEFDFENYTGGRFGVYLDYWEDNNFACGLCMFTEGNWKIQDYMSKTQTHYYGESSAKVPQSTSQKQHVKVTWTAEGQCSLYIDGKKVYDVDGAKNADEVIKKSPQGKIAFRRAEGSVTVSNIRPLKRQMVVTPSETKAVTAKIPAKLNVQYRSIADRETKATWRSSNENVAYVDRTGNVYFVGAGEADITATAVLADKTTQTAKNVNVSLPDGISAVKEKETANDQLILGAWANTEASNNPYGDGKASWAVSGTDDKDGNNDKKWHSQYNGFTVSEENPAKLTIEFAYDLSACSQIQFQQTGSSNNGYVTKYQVVVGDRYDEASHEIIDCQVSGIQKTEGNIVVNPGNDWVTLTLPQSEDAGGRLGRYLQIRVLNGNNNYACIKEIAASFQKEIAGNETEQSYMAANGQYVDAIKALETEIQTAKSADRKNYTEVNWQALQQAVADAEEALDSGAGMTVLAEKTQALKTAFEKTEQSPQIAVTFNWNFEGSGEEKRYVVSGKTVTVPEKADAPKRNGYYFTGKWYTEKECRNEFSANSTVTEDKTLYAEWQQEADKTDLNALLIQANEALIGRYTQDSKDALKTVLADAKGIADKEDASQDEIDQAKGRLQQAISALVKIYIVTFCWNDAENTTEEQDVVAEEYAKQPQDAPQWAGFQFTGKWYGNKKCTNEFSLQTMPVNQDMTLYATWNEVVDKELLNSYISEANEKLNGQYTEESKNSLRNQLNNAQIIADKEDASQSEVDEARKALKKALDELEPLKENYIVTFNWNFDQSQNQTQSVPEDGYASALTKADAPERDQFQFTGKWYTEPSCTNEFLFAETPITSNGIVLYAGWKKVRHTVTFNWNYTDARQDTAEVLDGESVDLPTLADAPKRDQFEFTGKWYTDQACQNEFASETEISDDLILYAKWVEFGLTQAKKELEGLLTQALKLVQADYSKTGWDTLQAAIAKAQTALTEETLASVVSSKEKLTVAMANTVVVEARTALQKLYDDYKAYDKNLYSAESWSVFETALQKAKTALDKADASLDDLNTAKEGLEAAKAALKTVVTVIFNWNYEGAETKQQNVEKGGKLTAPTEIPNRTGYEFTGKWYKEPACQTEFNFEDETVSDNMTLYAGWTNSVKTPLEEAKESLRTKISEAENLKAENYSETGWQALQTALADARKLVDGTATLDQLNQAIQALTKAAAYTKAAEIAEAKEQLSDLYSEYTSDAYDETVYTPESWSAFQKALQNAKTIIDKADASLEEVNAALIDIQAAEGDLSLKQEIKVDKTALQAQIASAEGLLSGHYTTVSLDALKAELAKAKEVAAKANATQTSVDQATARLKSAVESLVPLYTVTFNWNYEGAETQTQEVARGSHAAALIEAPARTGFEFTGLWYTDLECTKEYVFADETITKDLTLYAGWIAVSEEEIAAAKEALNALLAEAEKLQASDYSENGWQKVQAAKEAAKKAVSAGTLTGINQAKKALETAMAYTKTVETAEKKEELTTLYQQYVGDDYDEASYTTESWAPFQAALLHAKEVLDQSDASLEAVTEAAANLQKAAEGLSLRQDIVIDKTKLMEEIKKAEGLLSGKYTAESLKNLETKLAEARDVAAKDNATQKAVDKAEQSLKAAVESLVPLYTVTFDWNYEGGKTETQEVAKDGVVSAPTEIPAREGYTFTGKWYLEKECKTEFVVANETVQGDIILYAGWTVKDTEPSIPENPDDPYDPSVPENPDNPDQPSVPDKPNQPETPPDDEDNYSIVTKIQFAQSKYEIVKGKSINLENEIVSMMPEDPDDEELVWSSSNPKVAAVDESSGIVKTNKSAAKKTAIITVRNADEEIVASVRVKVMNGNVSKIRPKGKKVLSVKAGKSIKLKAIVSVKGKKPFNKKLKWVSSNTEVATVSSKLGLTTQVKIAKGAKKGKSVKITAISTDGTNKKLIFKLKVK